MPVGHLNNPDEKSAVDLLQAALRVFSSHKSPDKRLRCAVLRARHAAALRMLDAEKEAGHPHPVIAMSRVDEAALAYAAAVEEYRSLIEPKAAKFAEAMEVAVTRAAREFIDAADCIEEIADLLQSARSLLLGAGMEMQYGLVAIAPDLRAVATNLRQMVNRSQL